MSTYLRLSYWREKQWGAWSLICLYISVLSGIVVGLQYDYATAFYSSTSIDLLAPFGRYFRSLHFFSSQFFFLLTCIHLVAIYSKSSHYKASEWLKLTISLPVIVMLLFTGYVLRGDITGEAAGSIAENIIQTIPFLGETLNNGLFAISKTGLRNVYIHHVISFDFLFLVLIWSHLRTYRIKLSETPGTVIIVLVFSVFISAPLDRGTAGIDYIAGPWFFLGLQELLRFLHPLVAGVIAPVTFVAIALTAHPATSKNYRLALYAIPCILFLYSILTLIALSR